MKMVISVLLAIVLSGSGGSSDSWISKSGADSLTVSRTVVSGFGSGGSGVGVLSVGGGWSDRVVAEVLFRGLGRHFRHCHSLGLVASSDIGDCVSLMGVSGKPVSKHEGVGGVVSRYWAGVGIGGIGLRLQPPGNRVLARLPVIVVGDRFVQRFRVDVGGIGVTIRARVVGFDVDWGDGQSGSYRVLPRAYPNQTIYHSYRSGRYRVRLVSWWQASWVNPDTKEEVTEPVLLHTTEYSTWFNALRSSPVLINNHT